MQRLHEITGLERAFQLAKSGKCLSVDEVRKRLVAEGYPVTDIAGRTLNSQLTALIKAARPIA